MRSASSLRAVPERHLPRPVLSGERAELPPLAGDRRRAQLGRPQHPRPPEGSAEDRHAGCSRSRWSRRKSRWLVNRIYTIAVMNPPARPATVTHELGPADYAAPPPTSRDVRHERAPRATRTCSRWSAIIGVVLLIPLALGASRSSRARRWRRAVRASGRTELPPLPSSYRGGGIRKTRVAALTFSLLPWSEQVWRTRRASSAAGSTRRGSSGGSSS